MPVLNWRHHALIQALLMRGPLMEKEFHKTFTEITGKNPVDFHLNKIAQTVLSVTLAYIVKLVDTGTNPEHFNDYLLKINKELSYVQFELRVCRNQYDGQVCYGVVNNVSDEQSKVGTKYTVPQIAFYKGVIEAITQDANGQGSISNLDALNIRLENQVLPGTGSQSQDGSHHVPSAFKNFSLSQKEKTLDELVRDHWLSYLPDGRIGLGVRSFLDLRSWFRGTDVPSCEVCNEAGVKAQLCQNESCAVRIHEYCLEKKSSEKRGEIACPSCGTRWPYQVPKAEAIVEEDEPTPNTQNQPPLRPKRKRISAQTDVDSVGCSSSQAASATDLRRTTRSSAHLR